MAKLGLSCNKWKAFQTCFPGDAVVKNLSANAGDAGDADSVPGLWRSPGGRNGDWIQYSCLDNPVDRGAWWATDHGVAKSDTTGRLSPAVWWVPRLTLWGWRTCSRDGTRLYVGIYCRLFCISILLLPDYYADGIMHILSETGLFLSASFPWGLFELLHVPTDYSLLLLNAIPWGGYTSMLKPSASENLWRRYK